MTRALLIQKHGHKKDNSKYEDFKPKRIKEYGKPFSTFFDYGKRRLIEIVVKRKG
jgi:hypothetical protein